MSDQELPTKLPEKTELLVIIRDISDFVNMQEPVTHRSVRIQLTPEQIELLRLKATRMRYDTTPRPAMKPSDLVPVYGYEEISSCFLDKPTIGAFLEKHK